MCLLSVGGYTIVLCFCRVAVPLFFIISGFLLFRKLKEKDDEESYTIVRKYLLRNIKLYFSWFIILSPWIVIRKGYFEMEVWQLILSLLKDILLGSTFRASWYLSAQIIGVGIVFFLSKRVNNIWLLLIGLLTYIPCALGSGYGHLNSEIWTNLCNSFIVSIVWLSIGKCFADYEEIITFKFRSVQPAALSIAALVYIAEYAAVTHKGWAMGTDALFSMLILCPIVFEIVKDIKVTFPRSKEFRAFSVVTFLFSRYNSKCLKSRV